MMGKKCEEKITRPLIPVLVSFMAGIMAADYFPGYDYFLLPLLAFCMGLICLKIFKKKDSAYIPLLVFILLGYLSMAPFAETGEGGFSQLSPLKKQLIRGVVDEKPYFIGRRTKFTIRVKSLNGETSKFRGKLRVSATGELRELGAGSVVRFEARIKPIRNFENPGGFDYRRYLRFKGIYGRSHVDGEKIEVLNQPVSKGLGMLAGIEVRREEFASLVMANSTHRNAAAVLTALIVGKKDRLSEKCKDAFRRSGTAHLLAISGLHTGVVATACFALFYFILLRFKFLLWQALSRKWAAVLTIFPVFAYGLMAGFSPSVQRACIMVGVLLLAAVIEREPDPFNTIAAAAFVILSFSPVSVFSISFQLSFTAVCAILSGMGLVKMQAQTDASIVRKILIYTWASLLVSTFAILGTAPVVMYYFNQISLVGVIANFLILPVVCFLVVPVGLFSLLMMPVFPAVSVVFIKICIALLVKVIAVVYFFANLSFSSVDTFTPTLFEMGCYYTFWFAVVFTVHVKDRIRLKKRIFLLFGLIFAGICADASWWIHHRYYHNDFRVTAIDVGQGGASLLEIPGGFRILVDGGGFSGNLGFDVGKRVLAPFLRSKRIGYLDMVIMTHPEADHMNGLIYIVKNFQIGEFWSNKQVSHTIGYKKLMAAIEERGVRHGPFHTIPRKLNMGGVTLNLLHPPKWFKPVTGKLKSMNYNNNSLVILASMGVISFLLPGDIMAETEAELVKCCPEMLDSTVLFSPHHGSRSSSTQGFLDAVNPKIVVISTGWRKRFGLPHKTVMDRYARLNYKTLRTDVNGAVIFSTRGKSLDISHQK